MAGITTHSNAVDAFIAAAKAGATPQLGAIRQPGPTPDVGRLIFALDATASRQPTWDLATSITMEMFREAGAIGGLAMQLAYFRGGGEFRTFAWTSSASALVQRAGTIQCATGMTQVAKVLAHAEAETARCKVDALVFVGDAFEHVYDSSETALSSARALGAAGVRCFMFQEADDPEAKRVFQDIATASGGAYARFEAGAARKLADMLKAVAAFAAGGLKALTARQDQMSRLLLTQMKNGG